MPAVIDHVSLGCADLAVARVFYDAALAPLGLVCVHAHPEAGAGYGPAGGKPVFWIGQPHDRRRAVAGNGVHVAFRAGDRAAVDAFHRAALAAGAADEGAPGPRPHYHPHYYAAFVRDPDGNKVEAVCHKPA